MKGYLVFGVILMIVVEKTSWLMILLRMRMKLKQVNLVIIVFTMIINIATRKVRAIIFWGQFV